MNPPDFGAPAAFASWRPGQDDLLYRILGSAKRFVVLDAPVGVGKSLVLVTAQTALRSRGLYVTSNRGLQDQVLRDFGSIGMTDARGMRNYPCLEWPGRHCDTGPCLDGAFCKIRFNGCLYYDAVRDARKADLALTNYSLLMSLARNEDKAPFGTRDMLVLDEAHEAPDKLAEHMRIELKEDEVNAATWPLFAATDNITPWQEWAGPEAKVAEGELSDAPAGSEEQRKLKRLVVDLKRLQSIQPTERWVWQKTKHGAALEPIWAAPYAESSLFLGVPKVIFSSATIRPSTLGYLGVPPEEAEFISAPSPFAAARRPIYWLKTVRLRWDMDPFDTRIWLDRIDDVIEGRLDRKGIIHPTSYARAKYIKQASRFGHLMLFPTRDSLRDAVARFKSMPPPAILISPSVTTGYDFPYDAARYQIIAKVPFAPTKRDPVLALRSREDKGYPDWLVASSLQQTAGRIMRGDDDWGETFITDDHMQWFICKRELFARWFLEAFRKIEKVPQAPPLTRR